MWGVSSSDGIPLRTFLISLFILSLVNCAIPDDNRDSANLYQAGSVGQQPNRVQAYGTPHIEPDYIRDAAGSLGAEGEGEGEGEGESTGGQCLLLPFAAGCSCSEADQCESGNCSDGGLCL